MSIFTPKGVKRGGAEAGAVRRRITLTGSVQGVGLRWRACRAAEQFGCTGWVRNEPDGSVSMEIQGSGENIDRVLSAIGSASYVWFDSVVSCDIPVQAHERTFRCRY